METQSRPSVILSEAKNLALVLRSEPRLDRAGFLAPLGMTDLGGVSRVR